MNFTKKFTLDKKNQYPFFLSIISLFALIYLFFIWQSEDISLLMTSILFFLASGSLLWDKSHNFRLKTGFISSSCGGFLFAIVIWLIDDISAKGYGQHYRSFVPFFTILGIFLIASGFKGLKQYWKELAILFSLGLPNLITSKLIPDISPLTAKFSGFLLWYFGFDVSVQGININLPTTKILVWSACSGIDSITHLLGISFIFLIMFPLKKMFIVIVPVISIVIGFVVNGFRVVVMALLIASENQEAFEYWHTGDGSLLFTLFSVIIFGLFCQVLLSSSKIQQKKI